jgi:hypothetical protein
VEILVPHGYWLSFSSDNRLGILAQAQVDAATNLLLSHQFEYAYYPLGRVHFFLSDLEGQIMRSKTLSSSIQIDSSHVMAGCDPDVTSTILEFRHMFTFLQRNQQFNKVFHLVNPSHKERAQMILESLVAEKQSHGLDAVTFEFGVTTDYLSRKKATVVLNSAEQALFDNREGKIYSMLKNPVTRYAMSLMPNTVKRLMEDYYIYRLR